MTLLFRTDGSAVIGLGHVMRCLALAQAAREIGHASVFVTAANEGEMLDRLRAEGCAVFPLASRPGSGEDAIETVRLAREHGADWIIVDGYQFDTPHQKTVRGSGIPLLFVDDYGHIDQYDADIILNQNCYAESMEYRNSAASAQVLLGPTYALLRQEFTRWKDRKRTVAKTATRILVSMGGADARNDAGRVLQCLQSTPGERLEITIVSGAANPHRAFLERAAKESHHAVRLLPNVTNMAALMAQADAGIMAGGSTCYEALYMGLPSLVLITAENQERNVRSLEKVRAIVNVGWNTEVDDRSLISSLSSILSDQSLRRSLSAKGQGIVDGQGCARVLSAMQHFTHEAHQ